MAVNEKGEIIRKKNPQPDTSNSQPDTSNYNLSDNMACICFFGCIITFIIAMIIISNDKEWNFFLAFIPAVIISSFWPVLFYIYMAMQNSDSGMGKKIIANIYLWGGIITFVILHIAIIFKYNIDGGEFILASIPAGLFSVIWFGLLIPAIITGLGIFLFE